MPGPRPAPRNAPFEMNGHGKSTITAWTVVDLLLQRWYWLILGAIICGAGLYAAGWKVVKPKFTATAQLLRYEPSTSEFFKTTPMSAETFSGIMKSPDLLQRIGDQMQPRIPPETLAKQIKIDPEPDSDMVKVQVASSDPQTAVKLANKYAEETVVFMKELQAKHAADLVHNYLTQQVTHMDEDFTVLMQRFRGLPISQQDSNKLAQVGGHLNALNQQLALSPRPSLIVTKLTEKLQAAIAELADLRAKYTDIHPLVMNATGRVKDLETQISKASTNSALSSALSTGGLNGVSSVGPAGIVYDPEHEIIKTKLHALETARIELVNKVREAESYSQNPPGNVKVFAHATVRTTESNHRRIKIGLLGIFGAGLGMALSLMLVLLAEFMDNRVKTVDDVKRVTRLPVLTTLGELEDMGAETRAQWAFRTWTLLQGRLSRSANHGLVCGITSATRGEGRSTWIRLLAEAASLSGFRVLTIATRPSPQDTESLEEIEEQVQQLSEGSVPEDNSPEVRMHGNGETTALAKNVLLSPAEVTEKLTGPNSQPVVHIPLPGWVWNLERRKQWREALNHWRKIDNLVILVELPPASVPESILLGSNLPNLIWLSESGAAQAAETKAHLQTLRDARCNLVGAVLNRDTGKSIKRKFSRWIGCFAALGATTLSVGQAAEPDSVTTQLAAAAPAEPARTPAVAAPNALPETNLYFSVVSPAQRAAWQQKLTLGPGDVLSFSLYGEPQLTKSDVFIRSDGRVDYLEATNVLAAGLTVDELRARIDEELSKFRRAARTIIVPTQFRSKKYYVLGKVVQRGVYILDRPITVLEAITRAHGLENGLVDRNTIDIADLSRSFVMRRGQRIPVNFEKLFQSGDLSQNIPIEPEDYIFFPSTNIRELYVLGEVALPGVVPYTPNKSVVRAIAERGGFTEKAFKSRVLVVRGSVNNPETFVVNTAAITSGGAPDFKLEPKDIVYVNYRPWSRAEDLLELALTGFLQAVVAGYTGQNIVKP